MISSEFNSVSSFSNLKKCWTLRSADGGPVQLSFTDLRLNAYANCARDSITVYDGMATLELSLVYEVPNNVQDCLH